MAEYESLLHRLASYGQSGALPMHMPGHKRNPMAPYLQALGASMDITEINGFDDLHNAQGVLLEAQDRAAELWGAEESRFLVNGSSGGILAAVYAVTHRGGEILLARGSHKSAYHAVELKGLVPRFLLPPLLPETGSFSSVTPEQAEDAIRAYPKAKVMLITSPTYEGVISDVQGIARVCHENGVLLLVDEAHGAHLGLGGGFPLGAVAGGADLVVQSLHKTLPSLTQTAILHRQGNRVDPRRLDHALAVFQTSSPSYLLMACIDGCVTLLREHPEVLEKWRQEMGELDQMVLSLSRLTFPFRGKLPPDVFAYDPGKLVISSPQVSGFTLSRLLRERHNIELEMAAPRYALAMTGPGDTRDSLNRLGKALLELDKSLPEEELPQPEEISLYGKIPQLTMTPGDAMGLPLEFLPLQHAAGRTAGEYVWAYPPGIPLLLPGERIEGEMAEELYRLSQDSGRIHSTRGRLPREIAVVRA